MATPPPPAVVSTTSSGSVVPLSGSVIGTTFAEDSVGGSVGSGAGTGASVGFVVTGVVVGAGVLMSAAFGADVIGGSEAPLAED